MIPNRSIFAIDLRHNPGFAEKIQKKAALKMLRNIESASKSNVKFKRNWIIKSLIFTDPIKNKGINLS